MDNFLTTAAAGEILGVTSRQVRYWLDDGSLSGHQITPRMWLVDRESVEALKAKREAKKQGREKGNKES